MELKNFDTQLSIFENDLRCYIKACRAYDGSISAANGRYKCLLSLYFSLPYVIRPEKLDAALNSLSFADVEKCTSNIMEWAKNQIEAAPEPTKIM